MFRQIFWINLGLFIIVFLLGVNVYRVWHQIIKEEWQDPLYVSAEIMPEDVTTFENEQEEKPYLYTYDVIADKNLFRPQRTKWLPKMRLFPIKNHVREIYPKGIKGLRK